MAKINLQSTSYLSSYCYERKMDAEFDSTVWKLKLKEWQRMVIRDARVNYRCTTAVCNFEDSPRIQRVMEDVGSYKLLTLEDLELICLNRGCRAIPCVKYYQPHTGIDDGSVLKAQVFLPSSGMAVFQGSSQSKDGVPIEGSKKSKDGVAAIGILFQNMNKFYSQTTKQVKNKVQVKKKVANKCTNLPNPYRKSTVLSFPWKKILLGRSCKTNKKKKIISHYEMIASSSRPEVDPINSQLVYNEKLLFRFKSKNRTVLYKSELKPMRTDHLFKSYVPSSLREPNCGMEIGQTLPSNKSAFTERTCNINQKNVKNCFANITSRRSGWKVPAPGGLRGGHPFSGVMQQLDYQAETEIGHTLTSTEKDLLFSRFSLELVLSRIHQVCYLWFFHVHKLII